MAGTRPLLSGLIFTRRSVPFNLPRGRGSRCVRCVGLRRRPLNVCRQHRRREKAYHGQPARGRAPRLGEDARPRVMASLVSAISCRFVPTVPQRREIAGTSPAMTVRASPIAPRGTGVPVLHPHTPHARGRPPVWRRRNAPRGAHGLNAFGTLWWQAKRQSHPAAGWLTVTLPPSMLSPRIAARSMRSLPRWGSLGG